jgi:hypothetical protein
VGQAVLSGVLDVGALDAVEARLEARETARHAAFADQLRDVLELERLHRAAGLELATTAQLALVLRCSQARATGLLHTAQVLAGLPGALSLLDAAVLTVEQSRVVVELLEVLPSPAREVVWDRVSARLVRDAEQGVQRPPARLAELLRRWVLEADPQAAQDRRARAEEHGDVTMRRRDDGLVDVFATGLTAPNAAACLSRVTQRSAPFGTSDERTAGKRRLDALVDLLTGRDALAYDDDEPAHTDACSPAGRTCGCPLGAPVPCGAQVTVLVPLSTALGGCAPAELAGHGPLDADLARAVLLTAPVLRVAWVDADGVPVAVSDRAERLPRGDTDAVRKAVERLAADPPAVQPRHPNDHDVGPPYSTPLEAAPHSTDPPGTSSYAKVLDHPHPAGGPGPYRPPAALRRLLELRAPRCEWPGCGARASRCDLDHDLAWPAGPTCAANLGPLCRRHHRVKQLGWTKHRTTDGVRWTSPTLRTWLSPAQHEPPPTTAPAAAAPAPVDAQPADAQPADQLSPLAAELEDWLDNLGAIDLHSHGISNGTRTEEQQWAAELAALRRWAAHHDTTA